MVAASPANGRKRAQPPVSFSARASCDNEQDRRDRQIVRSTPSEAAQAPRARYELAQIPLYSAGCPGVAAKREAIPSVDAFEQEADVVADEVVRERAPNLKRVVSNRVASSDALAPSPDVADVLRAPGEPLGAGTRAFMEPRFGHDFGRVRVHTDTRAARSSEALAARAYTAGNDIVFARGEYSPHSENGKRLLAHELSHVVQQRGTGPRVLRKEVSAPLAFANRSAVAAGDWLDLDRLEWETASQDGAEASLSPTNTFMRAVYYNTEHLRPQEYTSIRERHDYYDLISYVLEHDPKTPAALQAVRFYHAATLVTGSPGIGTVDTPMGALKLHDQTRQMLRQVNEQLFALNMGIIQKLLFDWHEPRNPKGAAAGAIDSFDFDIKMVETEQESVEEYIAHHKSEFTTDVKGDVNATLDPDAFGQSFNPSSHSFEWAKKALNVSALDFTDIRHREAIGFATVHFFHRKSYGEYEAFMRKRTLVPARSP